MMNDSSQRTCGNCMWLDGCDGMDDEWHWYCGLSNDPEEPDLKDLDHVCENWRSAK